jgi:hypothetical protein
MGKKGVLVSREKHQRGHEDTHIFLGGVADLDLARASCQLDAAADRTWFQTHPGSRVRVRLASALELAALGLPPGTTVRVSLLPSGEQKREFFEPDC